MSASHQGVCLNVKFVGLNVPYFIVLHGRLSVPCCRLFRHFQGPMIWQILPVKMDEKKALSTLAFSHPWCSCLCFLVLVLVPVCMQKSFMLTFVSLTRFRTKRALPFQIPSLHTWAVSPHSRRVTWLCFHLMYAFLCFGFPRSSCLLPPLPDLDF